MLGIVLRMLISMILYVGCTLDTSDTHPDEKKWEWCDAVMSPSGIVDTRQPFGTFYASLALPCLLSLLRSWVISIFYADAGPLVGRRLLLPGLSQMVRSHALFSALVRPWKSFPESLPLCRGSLGSWDPHLGIYAPILGNLPASANGSTEVVSDFLLTCALSGQVFSDPLPY